MLPLPIARGFTTSISKILSVFICQREEVDLEALTKLTEERAKSVVTKLGQRIYCCIQQAED